MEIGRSKRQLKSILILSGCKSRSGFAYVCPNRDMRPEHGPNRDLCSGFVLPKNGKRRPKHSERDVIHPERDRNVPRSTEF